MKFHYLKKYILLLLLLLLLFIYLFIYFLQAPLHPCEKKEDCHENAECHEGKCHCLRTTVGNGKHCEGIILSNDILRALTDSDIAGGNGGNGSSFSKHLVVDVFCPY